MSIWHVNGENRLSGSITIQGAKNAALPILAATVVAPCETELLNVPQLRDVDTTISILEQLGCIVSRDGDAVSIDSRRMHCPEISGELMREMRSSVIFMGALLARCGEARLYTPGGCELGPRPIDLHLMALRALGAEIEEKDGEIYAHAGKLRGATIDFPMPSVGATENAMLAACAADGVTVLRNAAREPEIVNLQAYLQALGVKISGAGTPVIVVEGFTPVECVGHRIIPDRIVASTILCAVASAGGDVEIRGAEPEHIAPVLHSLSECGCGILAKGRSVRIRSGPTLRAPGLVITGPYPAFPTDAQPLLLAACLRAQGSSVFVEKIFSERFRYIEELRKLGASVHTEGGVAVVTGVRRLVGADVRALDLRGGAALIISALAAEGETRIEDSGHITRGYERLDKRLGELGAEIFIET